MAVEGLEIRRAEPDDCNAIYEMFRSPKVYEGTLQLPYPSREQWRKRISETDGCYNLVAVSGEHVIGMLTVDTFPNRPRRRHVGRIGISVSDEWQGKGVGKALMRAGIDLADKWLNLTRLELEVYADNESAIRLYEQFGFEREGVLRQHAFRDGRYVDSIMMARLRTF
ncbi:MAG TPA: GNAT family N-acetyltransferase [Pyrinomonadaceae bacterium]|nr:GNAT family N-acetyltransferase [Pyrinomonadaceae bacterium]